MKNTHRAFFFLLAGGTGFLMYLCISNVMHYVLHASVVASAAIGTLLPVLPTFWMQRKLTFQSNKPKRQALPRYALLQLGNAGLISGLTAVGEHMGQPGVLVFLFAGIIGTLISYFVQLKIVFR